LRLIAARRKTTARGDRFVAAARTIDFDEKNDRFRLVPVPMAFKKP
jgi:hypothetical protein